MFRKTLRQRVCVSLRGLRNMQKRNAVSDDMIFILVIFLMIKSTVIQNQTDRYAEVTILNMYIFFSMIKWYQLLKRPRIKQRNPITHMASSRNRKSIYTDL